MRQHSLIGFRDYRLLKSYVFVIKEKLKLVANYWLVVVFFIAAIFVVLTSKVTIGEPRVINATVVSIGVTQGAGGSSIFLVCRTVEGNIVRASTFQNQRKVGDEVTLLSYDRLFFSDVYVESTRK